MDIGVEDDDVVDVSLSCDRDSCVFPAFLDLCPPSSMNVILVCLNPSWPAATLLDACVACVDTAFLLRVGATPVAFSLDTDLVLFFSALGEDILFLERLEPVLVFSGVVSDADSVLRFATLDAFFFDGDASDVTFSDIDSASLCTVLDVATFSGTSTARLGADSPLLFAILDERFFDSAFCDSKGEGASSSSADSALLSTVLDEADLLLDGKESITTSGVCAVLLLSTSDTFGSFSGNEETVIGSTDTGSTSFCAALAVDRFVSLLDSEGTITASDAGSVLCFVVLDDEAFVFFSAGEEI
jgi:hypothetical protein